MGSAAVRPFDLQTVLDTLTKSAASLCEADMAAIIRQDEDGEGFHYATNYEFPPDWQEFIRTVRFAPGRGSIVGQSLLELAAVHVDDILACPSSNALRQFTVLLSVEAPAHQLG